MEITAPPSLDGVQLTEELSVAGVVQPSVLLFDGELTITSPEGDVDSELVAQVVQAHRPTVAPPENDPTHAQRIVAARAKVQKGDTAGALLDVLKMLEPSSPAPTPTPPRPEPTPTKEEEGTS